MGYRTWPSWGPGRRRPDPPPTFSRLPEESAAARARGLLSNGPSIDVPSRYGTASRLVRRLIARLTRHERLHQRAVGDALLESAQEAAAALDARIDALGQATNELANSFADADARMATLETRVAAMADRIDDQSQSADLAQAATEWRSRLLTAWPDTRASIDDLGARRPPVRVATDVGSLLFPAGDDFITPYVQQHGTWEKEECAALRSLLQPGMSFIDIGAHVGYLTLVAAEVVGPHGFGVAIEPEETNFSLLRANLLTRGVDNVVPLRAAAWRETTVVTLGVSSDNSGDHRAYGGAVAGGLQVVGLALDDVIPDHARVNLVKIDAQGRDHLAVEGMQQTLARSRPLLLVEFWPPGISEVGDDPRQVLSRYQSLGFEISLLGIDAPTSPEEVMDVAGSNPGDYCTIVLRPVS